ncbi:MAG TPA: SDR family NAD(P)-dependent oxidoreductase [Vicinamibacterales bacterium]|nr:SDR family NAD(P)-dependent oxidoreductase [Vicinamibacterales bacterium]
MGEKVVVITGASSGIGAALAEALAKRGMAVVLVARRQAALEEVAARCGDRSLAIAADMTRREDATRVVDAALARFGRIDVWVNNVGLGINRMPSALTDEDIDLMILVNVKSAIYGTQAVLPHFTSRNDGQIINVSSMLGRAPFAVFRSAYSASKHFLNAITANLRDELHETHPGIQVTLVSPGVVRTDFGKNAVHGGPDSRSLPNSQSAEEVAAVIAWAIETRPPDVYTRRGAAAMIAKYYTTIGADPA